MKYRLGTCTNSHYNRRVDQPLAISFSLYSSGDFFATIATIATL